MTKVLYPSWRYHATEKACIVQNQAESDALGPGWSDTPAPVAAASVPEADPVVGSTATDAEYPADEDEPADEGESPDAPKKRGRKPKK